MSGYRLGSRFYQNALGIPATRPRRRPAVTSYGGDGSGLVGTPSTPNPLIDTLTDDFATQNARWQPYGGATISGGQVNAPIAGTTSQYAGIDMTAVGAPRYNAFGTTPFIKATHGAVGPSQEVSFEIVADDGSKISVYRSGSATNLYIRVISPGNDPTPIATPNVTDPWWRINVAANGFGVTASTSPDGITWTQRLTPSLTAALSPSFASSRINMAAGDYLGSGTPSSATFDNLNFVPAVTNFAGSVALSGSGTFVPDGPPIPNISGSLALSGDSNLDTSGSAATGGSAATILAQNDFSGVPDGATLTLANSAASGQNAFDSVTTNGTVISDSSLLLHGKRTITDQTSTTAVANSFGWNSGTLGASATRYFRFYLYVAAIPGSTITIGRWTVGGTSTLLGSTVLTNTGLLRITNSAGTTIGTMTAAVPTGQWIRVEGQFTSATSTTGSAALSYYTSPESTTPTQTVSGSNTNFGTGNIDTVRFGHTQSVANVDLHFAEIAVANDAPIGPVGSVAAPPQNFTGSLALSGDSALNLVASGQTSSGTDTMSGSGTLTNAGTPTTSGSVGASGSGVLNTVPSTIATSGSRPATGSGSLTVTGSPTTAGTASTSGSGALTASGSPRPLVSLPLAGTGSLSTVGSAPTVNGPVSLSGSGTLTLSGVQAITGFAGTVNLSGNGTIAGTGKPALVNAYALSGAGTLSPSARITASGSTAFTGSGAITITGKPIITRSLAFTGTGDLGSSGKAGFKGTLARSGDGLLYGVIYIPPRDITIFLVAPVFTWDAVIGALAWTTGDIVLLWTASLLGQTWDAALLPPIWEALGWSLAWDTTNPTFAWASGDPFFD